jgi:RNA-splicing ligase RtcB
MSRGYGLFEHDADFGIVGRGSTIKEVFVAAAEATATQGVIVRTRSMRGVAEEAPGVYKDVQAVAESTERAGLARRVAELRPRICIEG